MDQTPEEEAAAQAYHDEHRSHWAEIDPEWLITRCPVCEDGIVVMEPADLPASQAA